MKKRTKVVLILSVIFSFVVASFVFAVQVNAQDTCHLETPVSGSFLTAKLVNCGVEISDKSITIVLTKADGSTETSTKKGTFNGWSWMSSYGDHGFWTVSAVAPGLTGPSTVVVTYDTRTGVQSTAVPQQGQVIIVTATPSSPMVTIVPNGQGGGIIPGANQILVVDHNLNLREGPGVNRKVIVILAVGTVLDYKGENPGDDNTRWFYAKFGDKLGWVKANRTKLGEGTTIVKIDVANPPAVVTVKPTATPAATQATAWTCGPALQASYGATMRSTMEGKPLNVRIGPATTYPKVDSLLLLDGQMPNGTEFGITGDPVCDTETSIIWWPMSLKLKEQVTLVTGWVAQGDETKYFIEVVSAALITPVPPTPTPDAMTATPAPTMDTVVLNKDDVKVYEKPDTTSKVLFVAPKGTVAPFKLKFITMSKKVWYEVYTGNGTGWIQAEDAIWNGDDPTATPHAA